MSTKLIIHKALAVVRPQFSLDFNDGIHGVSHWARVWHHGKRIAHDEGINPATLAWFAFLHDSHGNQNGPTPLVAAMRCYAKSKFGESVHVPKELAPAQADVMRYAPQRG